MISLQPSINGENLRQELKIPDDAIVFARYGGMDTFNIPFCWQVIYNILETRENIYFLFINTPRPFEHKRMIHLPKITSDYDKNKFISTCDAHLECGTLGHSFGLAIAEFSVNNKPIIAYNKNLWNTAHIDILKDKGIYFTTSDEFYNILTTFDPKKYKDLDLNCYREYTPEKVMRQFEKIFL